MVLVAGIMRRRHPNPPVERTGTRSSTDRNWFRHKNRHDRWAWVHADVNGAFNIIRKVFHAFAYHSGLTLKFTLFRLSPRLNAIKIKFCLEDL